jgi:hypothetical protein
MFCPGCGADNQTAKAYCKRSSAVEWFTTRKKLTWIGKGRSVVQAIQSNWIRELLT